jgi:hypothetical protein
MPDGTFRMHLLAQKAGALAFSYRNAVVALFYLYAFVSILLPSGSIFGVNVKIMLALGLLASAVFFDGDARIIAGWLVQIMVLACFLLAWVVGPNIVYMGKFALGLSQAKDILVTFLLPGMLCFLVARGGTTATRFLDGCCTWSICLALVKVGILAYSALSGVPVVQVMDQISKLFGVLLMSFDLGGLGGRIHFVGDFLIPAVLYYYIAQRNKKFGWSEGLVVGLLLFSVVISFTRYLWLYSVIALLLAWATAGRNTLRLSVVFAVLVAIVLLVSGGTIVELIRLRFSNDVAGASDIERILQIKALYNWFLDAPIFGHGLGAYTRQNIRSELLPYSYEVQLLALLGQIGIVGCSLLGVLIGYLYWRTARYAKSWPKALSIAVLLAVWLAGGFFNPNLFSSAAAVIFGAFWAMWQVNSVPAESETGMA